MKRRDFLTKTSAGGLLLAAGGFPFAAFSDPDFVSISLLHTNDTHSRIEPFPMDGGANQGLGGVARRAALIEKIRDEMRHVLLFDAGDIFQGTPYFNIFKGELEFKLMSKMGYDAATIGNHDFDAGIEGLEKQLPHANFPFLICNYDFSNTVMNGKTQPYKIFKKEGVKIGVTGVGIQLEGLVPKKDFQETRYLDPVRNATDTAAMLKHDEKCHFVVCLSHLGYEYRDHKVSDKILAAESSDIDLIIGGHTHTFLEKPVELTNKKGKPVVINQVGWAGIKLGRLDLVLEKNGRRKCVTCSNHLIA